MSKPQYDSEYAIQLSDFTDRYVVLCSENDKIIVKSLYKSLRDAIDGGPIPTRFNMSGKLNDVRYNRIDDSYINVFVPSLAGLTFLVELDLSFNDIKCPGACIIASYIQNDKFIRRLSLKSNSIETVGGIALAKAIQLNETLHRFDISYNSVGERTGQQIACTLQINYSLTHLSIAGCSLGSSSIIALATALQNNDNIRYIDISNNKIHPSLESDVVMHISNMLRYNDGIMEFNLSKFGIGDWTMVNHLSGAIRWNRKISKLNLSCNRITKDGCVALAKSLIDTQRVLTILNLSWCAVQDEGAANIAAMLGRNSTLVKLYIDHNKITGRGLRDLSKALMLNRSIQYITLWGNLWDVSACDEFSKLVGGPMRILQTDNSGCGKDHGTSTLLNRPSRLDRNHTDVIFYSVDNVLNVAKNNAFVDEDYE
ncbi:hypothetical protein HDU79_003603 [Rhizoclosmatium sp. JEL0117]|nr:hypothetical protein HDU79_003603 [Rhizoclosmatium sp. JEL0117]